MMYKEIDCFGVYLPPLLGCVALAILVFVPLSAWMDRKQVHRHVWNRPVFDAAFFVILLTVVTLFFNVF